MIVGYDVMGNVAILKFDREAKARDKKKFALDYLEKHKNVRTVLEKSEKFTGRLRKLNNATKPSSRN
jgi:tRNA G37 N-methylase Trm5